MRIHPFQMAGLNALALCALLTHAGAQRAAEAAESVIFTTPPQAKAEKEGARIRFAVQRETDVEVSVLDAQGAVVCHLAAGMLGKNPPEPLKAGALAQELYWDGKDDAGNPAVGGPFSIRVRAGMKPRFSHFIGEYPELVGPVYGLGCDENGHLYVASRNCGMSDATQVNMVKVFDREGRFVRQLMPFPGNLPREKLEGLDLLDRPEGGFVPKIRQFSPYWIYPYELPYDRRKGGGLFLFPGGGKVAVGVVEGQNGKRQHLAILGTDGSVGKDSTGPELFPEGARAALSPDGKTIYLTKRSEDSPALYRLSWKPGDTPKEFIGQAGAPDPLKAPKGVAVGGDGRIYVCDSGNDRIAIFSPDGKPAGEISAAGPEEIAIHPKSGAIYLVQKGAENAARKQYEQGFQRKLVRFDGATSEKPSLELDLGATQTHVSFCLDASAEKPILWIATCLLLSPPEHDEISARVLKVVDEGGQFLNAGYPVSHAHRPPGACGAHMQTIPFDPVRDELLTFWSLNFGNPKLGPHARVDGATGKVLGEIKFGNPVYNDEMIRGGNGDYLAFDAMENALIQYDAAGQGREIASLPAGHRFPSGFTRAPDGTYYALHSKENRRVEHPRVTRVGADRKILQKDLVQINGFRSAGVQVDRKGNIYVGVRVVPKAHPLPGWIRNRAENLKKAESLCFYYGSILKFGPAGGIVENRDPKGEGEQTLSDGEGDDNLLVSIARGAKQAVYHRVKAVGVAGVFEGYGHIGSIFGGLGKKCCCWPTRFGLDGHARVFIPDVARCSVGIADTNGNPIARFGGYGNQDSRGGGVKGPEVPFTLIKSVSVSDRFCYVLDGYNHRIVAVKLSFEAEKISSIAR